MGRVSCHPIAPCGDLKVIKMRTERQIWGSPIASTETTEKGFSGHLIHAPSGASTLALPSPAPHSSVTGNLSLRTISLSSFRTKTGVVLSFALQFFVCLV